MSPSQENYNDWARGLMQTWKGSDHLGKCWNIKFTPDFPRTIAIMYVSFWIHHDEILVSENHFFPKCIFHLKFSLPLIGSVAQWDKNSFVT